MTRLALLALAPLALAGCLAAPPEPEAGAPVAALQAPTGPLPLDVLRALPAGVSTTSVRQDATGCYFYDAGAGPVPVTATTTAGQQPVCA